MTDSLLMTFKLAAAIVFVAATVLFTIAEWKIFRKAGEKGWKALIPFYCVFVSHHIVGMSHLWFVIEAVIWVTEIALEMLSVIPEAAEIAFLAAVTIFTMISELIHVIRMCTCFGKRTGFKIGMALLPNLFFLILAFGKAEYQKPKH